MRQGLGKIVAVGLLQLVACSALQAREIDALQLLSKAMHASSRLNYSGTFVYRHGSSSETSRITHFLDGGKEYEHLEVLDGSAREVVREGEEVTCYMPESRTVFIEKRNERGTFPAILPASLLNLGEYYTITPGTGARVAGHETQSIVLTPRDPYRYAHAFWIDKVSGLLLKATVSHGQQELLESFAFTEIKLGIPVDHSRMRVRLKTTEDWHVHHVAARDNSRLEDSSWAFKNIPPGFKRTAGMRRQVRLDTPESLHFVFSDGLSAISVFIEPHVGNKPDKQVVNMGSINAYRRISGAYQILVMGDVPAAAIKRLADGVEFKAKH